MSQKNKPPDPPWKKPSTLPALFASRDLLLICPLVKRARVHSIHKEDASSPTPAHSFTKSKSKFQSLPSTSLLPFRQKTQMEIRPNVWTLRPGRGPQYHRIGHHG